MQAYGVLYLSLQLRRDGLDAAAVRAARPQIEAPVRALAEFMRLPLQPPDTAAASAPRGGGAAAALQTLELSAPSLRAIVCLALGLCPVLPPGSAAADSAASLQRAAALAAEAEDPGLAGICGHFSALTVVGRARMASPRRPASAPPGPARG